VQLLEDKHRDESSTECSSKNERQLLYLDPRSMRRDCIACWLNANLEEFGIRVFGHPNEIDEAAFVPGAIRVIVYNAGMECVSSCLVAEWLERLLDALPDVPIVLLSDCEDHNEIIETLELGVRGYIPTSLTSDVAAEAIRLVCAGGTFAPAAAVLSALRERSRQERLTTKAPKGISMGGIAWTSP
jgi:DNA-binding NarL/FixJ family response regulator